jgi:CRP-like cAMP-binding protein
MNTSIVNNQPVVDTLYPKNITLESPFLTHAKSICKISPAAQEFINQKTFPSIVHKGDILVRAGEINKNIYFLQSGIMRSYVREGIKDITTWIVGEQEFVSCISSFGLQQPVRENLQALEDCELSGFRLEDLQYLYDNYQEINVVSRVTLEKYLRDAEERAFISRLTEATAKYKYYHKTKFDMLSRVPLKFIASYLGMTTETLSRIRGKISRTTNGF